MSTSPIEDFRAVYEEYRREVLEPTRLAIYGVFAEWRAPEYWGDYRQFEESALPSPTQRTKVRIKRIESVTDKFRRMPDEFPGEPSLENLKRMRDVLGARVITYFPSQLAMVDQEIRSGSHFQLSTSVQPKSYLPREVLERLGLDIDGFRGASAPKPSGYASLHYCVRLKSPVRDSNPWFEVQARTMLEEVWGEVEHQIGYKPDRQTSFSVKRQFRVISGHLAALDDHFDFLYNEIAFQQANSTPEDNDPVNAENLPRVLRTMEIIVLQKEIAGLLRVLNDYGIETVGGLMAIGRIELVEAIQSEYRHLQSGRTPTAFDVIPILVLMNHRSTAEDAKRTLRTHMEWANQHRAGRGKP